MSRIYSINDCILLSHKQFIDKIYEKNLLINSNDVELKSMKLNSNIFMINTQYLRKNQTQTLTDSNSSTGGTNINKKVKIKKKRKLTVTNEDKNNELVSYY